MAGKRVLRNNKPLHKSDYILLVLAIFMLSFIVCMVVTHWVTGSTPDTLIQCVLGGGGVEASVLGAIKIAKIIRGEKSLPTESEDTYADDL